MPEHGEFDLRSHKWYCRYWMSQEEWEDTHDYAPPNKAIAGPEEEKKEHEHEQEEEEEG